MPLTSAQRKERLPYGAQQELARRLGVSETYISLVMAGEVRPKLKRTKLKLRRTQRMIARVMGLELDEAFSDDELGFAAVAA